MAEKLEPTSKTLLTYLYQVGLIGKKEDKVFYNTLKQYTEEHTKKYPLPSQNFESYFDTGYQIQRTKPESVGYTWHHDFVVTREDTGAVAVRVLTYIWYLNTIDYGGYTEFANGESVKPETGKLTFVSCRLVSRPSWNSSQRQRQIHLYRLDLF